MVLDAQTPVEERSLMEMVATVAIEEPDAQTLKMWARLAAQALTLDLMAVTAKVYDAFWWHFMAVNAWKNVVAYAQAGRWEWVVSWLGSEYTEVYREGQCWEEVMQRLSALSASGVRAAWWLRYATEQHEQMVVMAQQVQSVVLALCTTLGLALPKEVMAREQATTGATTEDEVGE